MFVSWAKGEKHHCISSLHSISSFLSASYRHSGAPEWSLIRRVYDWRAIFDPIRCDISGYSSARIFKFIKEESRVLMWYKTNTTENERRGFQYEENGITHTTGISVCTSYISSPPPPIPPRQLDITTINVLATDNSFTTYYDQPSKNFWNDLLENSTNYLTQTFFTAESKFYHIIFIYLYRNPERFTSW